MQPGAVTFIKALKIWWSYAWRATVLTLLLVFLVGIVTIVFGIHLPHTVPPQPRLSPEEARQNLRRLLPLLVPYVLAAVIVRTYAMMWMLRTKWSNFSIQLTANGKDREPS